MVTNRRLTSPPPEFDLVPLEVGLVFYYFHKTLKKKKKRVDLVANVAHHQFYNSLTCFNIDTLAGLSVSLGSVGSG